MKPQADQPSADLEALAGRAIYSKGLAESQAPCGPRGAGIRIVSRLGKIEGR
jgi:hypothetical protein